jgi:hypothetical protein
MIMESRKKIREKGGGDCRPTRFQKIRSEPVRTRTGC